MYEVTPQEDYNVTVIGGGIAGLVAAYDCMRAGKTVLLIEKEPRLGGRIQTADIAGTTVDTGAESFAVRSDSVAGLAKDLGYEDHIIAPSINQSWLYNYDDKSSYAAGVQAILGIPDMLLGTGETFAQSLGEEGYRRALGDLEVPWDISLENVRSMSLAELVENRLGCVVVERLVSPVVKAVYGVDPYLVTADSLVPGFARVVVEQRSVSKAAVMLKNHRIDGDDARSGMSKTNSFSAVMSFDSGMGALVETLAAKLRESLNVDIVMDAVALRRCDGSSRVRLPQVSYLRKDSNDAVTVRSGAVVNACPPAGEDLGRNSIAVVVVALEDERLGGAPRGTGIIAYGTAPYPGAKAITHVSAKWGNNPAFAQLKVRGIHIVRLSYDFCMWEKLTRRCSAADVIVNDAAVLFGISDIPSENVVDWAQAYHQETGSKAGAGRGFRQSAVDERAEPESSVIWVGHSQSGGSVANIVAETRQKVSKLIESMD